MAVPQSGWSLDSCGRGPGEDKIRIKVLTYNLYWWNLFGVRKGNHGSSSRLIAKSSSQAPIDFMAFQECEDVARVLSDAGLTGEYQALPAQHALAVAYRKADWLLLAQGDSSVAEDRPDQWYGRRDGQWARFRHHATARTVFFINHHGPLPVNSGGVCGGRATASNILKVIAAQAHANDAIILAGDFNAAGNSEAVRLLSGRLHHVYGGTKFGGVDHIFNSCGSGSVLETVNLGDGGSDHDALSVVLQV